MCIEKEELMKRLNLLGTEFEKALNKKDAEILRQHGDMSDLDDQIDQLMSEVEKAKGSTKNDAYVSTLETQNQEMAKRIVTLEASLESSQAGNAKLEADLVANHNDPASAENVELVAKVTELEERLEKARGLFKQQKKDLNQLRKAGGTVDNKEEVEGLQKQVDALTREVETYRKVNPF